MEVQRVCVSQADKIERMEINGGTINGLEQSSPRFSLACPQTWKFCICGVSL